VVFYIGIKLCSKFTLKLAGKAIEPKSRSKSQIYNLVAMIESEFDRDIYPEVYHSLLAIHRYKQKVLIDLLTNKNLLSEAETFKISIEKGVIADGYLVLGNLDETQFSL